MNTTDNSAPDYPPSNVPQASGAFYDSTPGATVGALDDLDDLLSEKLHHLSALLKVPYADSGKTFRNLNPSIQDNYMWCCSALVDECQQLAMRVSARRPPRMSEPASTLAGYAIGADLCAPFAVTLTIDPREVTVEQFRRDSPRIAAWLESYIATTKAELARTTSGATPDVPQKQIDFC